jgi:hypothetical protein
MSCELDIENSEFALTHILFLCLGIGLSLISVVLDTNSKNNFFTGIKNFFIKVKNEVKFWYKKSILLLVRNVLLYSLLVFVLLLLLNISYNLIGLTIIDTDYFTYLISLCSRIPLLYLVKGIFFIGSAKNLKEWSSIIGINPYTYITVVPFSYIVYYYVIPLLINFKALICFKIDSIIASLKEIVYNFTLAIKEIVYNFTLAIREEITTRISNYKQGLGILVKWFFWSIYHAGNYLIRLPNRPGQLGKVLVSFANWGLDSKPASVSKNQMLPANNYKNPLELKEDYRLLKFINSKSFISLIPERIYVPHSNTAISNIVFGWKGSLKSLTSGISEYSTSIVNMLKASNNPTVKVYLPDSAIELKLINEKLVMKVVVSEDKSINCEKNIFASRKDISKPTFFSRDVGYFYNSKDSSINELLELTNPNNEKKNIIVNMSQLPSNDEISDFTIQNTNQDVSEVNDDIYNYFGNIEYNFNPDNGSDEESVSYNNDEQHDAQDEQYGQHDEQDDRRSFPSFGEGYQYEPIVYDRLPSYHTYPSTNPPSFRTYESHIPYSSELPEGEVFVDSSTIPTIYEDNSDDESVASEDISVSHMVTIRAGHTTRSTYRLIEEYSNDHDSERFSEEISRNLASIDADGNRTTQRITKDNFKRLITNKYAKKALEIVEKDMKDLRDEVLSTDQTVKESIWDIYSEIPNNPWSIGGVHEQERENVNLLQHLPYNFQSLRNELGNPDNNSDTYSENLYGSDH